MMAMDTINKMIINIIGSLERPVFNDSEAINLTFGLTLQQIIDVVSPHTHPHPHPSDTDPCSQPHPYDLDLYRPDPGRPDPGPSPHPCTHPQPHLHPLHEKPASFPFQIPTASSKL